MMDVVIAIYNKLDENSPYRSDIFDLFGTQDQMSLGVIGTKYGSQFKSLNWDWGTNGIKKICKFLYWNENGTLACFAEWYENSRKSNHTDLIEMFDRVLYVFNYKGKKISAFVASLGGIEKKEKRIWLRFTPAKFVLLPPEFMQDYWNTFFSGGREDYEKWAKYLENRLKITNIKREMEEIFSSSLSQDQYHIIPVDFIEDWVEDCAEPREVTKPIFVATVEDNRKLLKKGLPTNNQVFWSIFSQYVGRSQVRGSFAIMERGSEYRVTDVPVSSFSERGLVYNQEVGTPYAIFQALSDIFQETGLLVDERNRLIEIEFGNCPARTKSVNDLIIMDRAEKVSSVAEEYDPTFAGTDYDYAFDLSHLGIPRTILIDVTTGLWHKGIGRDKKEYVKQWMHNIVEVARRNQGLLTVWHYGLKRYETYKGKEVGRYLIERTRLEPNEYLYLDKTALASISVPKDLKVVFLPFYDDNPQYNSLSEELRKLDPSLGPDKCRQTVLYRCWKVVGREILRQN